MTTVVNRIGETNIANNGQLMTVINYRKSNDIDVQFEDGSIVMHRTYLCFRKGHIANPNFNLHATKFIGQKNKNSDGQTMKIIAYRNSKDIDVQFDDGTIIEHRNYVAFLHGLIHNPNCTHHVSQRVCRTGLSKLTRKGLILTISTYRKYKNVDYIFDTGYEVKHRTYEDFEQDKIKHPFPYMIGTVSLDKPAYIHNNTGNFYCHCTKCSNKDILTVEEIKNHICINE